MQSFDNLVAPINNFLQCPTPKEWLVIASKPESLPVLLNDHLMCELKAAQTAAHIIRKYSIDKRQKILLNQWLLPFENFVYKKQGNLEDLNTAKHLGTKHLDKNIKIQTTKNPELLNKLILLITEELQHLYLVVKIMQQLAINIEYTTASRYAKGLISNAATAEPMLMIDKLICAAFIEARSCERFWQLAPYLTGKLRHFYQSLLRSEARHFEDYLKLAQSLSSCDITDRINYFRKIENQLISSEDMDFKFHSGVPFEIKN